MTMGRPTESLNDIELTRELAHAHLKRHDTFLTGSADALRNHSRRTAELELAYARRFSAAVVDAEQKVVDLS